MKIMKMHGEVTVFTQYKWYTALVVMFMSIILVYFFCDIDLIMADQGTSEDLGNSCMSFLFATVAMVTGVCCENC